MTVGSLSVAPLVSASSLYCEKTSPQHNKIAIPTHIEPFILAKGDIVVDRRRLSRNIGPWDLKRPRDFEWTSNYYPMRAVPIDLSILCQVKS